MRTPSGDSLVSPLRWSVPRADWTATTWPLGRKTGEPLSPNQEEMVSRT